MSTVDEGFRSVAKAWPVVVLAINMLRSKGCDKAKVADLLSSLVRHWPTPYQVAVAYHAVAANEFSSQSYQESWEVVQRWHKSAQNALNAYLNVEHCDGEGRHVIITRPHPGGQAQTARLCDVCGRILEVKDWSDQESKWRPASN